MTWATGTVSVKTAPAREETVQAALRGPFAVHQTFMNFGHPVGWTLTHVATGRAIAQELPSEGAAKDLADAVEPLLDWNLLTLADSRVVNPAVKAEIQRLIAKISVEHAHAPWLQRRVPS